MEKTESIFDKRNLDKKHIQKFKKHLEPNIWEIRMHKVWVNIWNELSKEAPHMRPCIILNQYVGWDLVLIVPLTSKKHNSRYEIEIKDSKLYWLSTASYVLINQIKTISKKRLIHKFNGIIVNNKRIKLVPASFIKTITISFATKILKL